jgi:hypothetical protein
MQHFNLDTRRRPSASSRTSGPDPADEGIGASLSVKLVEPERFRALAVEVEIRSELHGVHLAWWDGLKSASRRPWPR